MASNNPSLSQVNAPPTADTENRDVAIIAIHGVGKHLSGASADAVATLLMSLGRCNTGAPTNDVRTTEGAYEGFLENPIEVPLRPVQSPAKDAENVNKPSLKSGLARIWGMFDERRGFLGSLRENKDTQKDYSPNEWRNGEPDRGEFGFQFMLTQIAGYRGEVDRSFETVRLEGKRTGAKSASNVHIYDAHYSNLSKPESTILSFFLAFYQLLVHLASLSLQAVYWAEAENVRAEKDKANEVRGEKSPDGKQKTYKLKIWRWRIESSIHATSVRFLVMWVPFLNLILLEIACSAFIEKTGDWGKLPSVSLAAILSLGATFWCIRQLPSPARPLSWALLPFLGAAFGVVFLGWLVKLYMSGINLHQDDFSKTLLLFGWFLLAGLILGFIGKKFDPLRPGAFWLSMILYISNALFYLICLLPHAVKEGNDINPFATASLWAVQWIFGELLLSWVICLICAFVSWPLSAFCTRGIDKHNEDQRARSIAAFRTGRFAFSVPAILFVVVTCALWSGVVVKGAKKFGAYDNVVLSVVRVGPSANRPIDFIIPSIDSVECWMKNHINCNCDVNRKIDWPDYLTGLLLVSATPGILVTIGLFVLSLFLLSWAVLPSVIFEVKPAWTLGVHTNRIRSLGEWVSRGLDNTAILTRAMWFAIVPVPLFFLTLDWLSLNGYLSRCHRAILDHASALTLPFIEMEGFKLAISGAVIFGVILKYLTPVLDTILDVDNYLRTSPKDKTPRALIAERCTSLLRYIANYTDPNGRRYSKVIFVAHSLGSMVTTDLLRYLDRSGTHATDRDLAPYGFRREKGKKPEIPIYILSMGSPLRQLLNRFFPHLYWWVSDTPDNSLRPVGEPVGPDIPKITSPLPRADEMNVTLWSNMYRSGDYVGRSLWIGQWFCRNTSDDLKEDPDIAQSTSPCACNEACIGLGAHTHYWDRSAPEVAKRLDGMIG